MKWHGFRCQDGIIDFSLYGFTIRIIDANTLALYGQPLRLSLEQSLFLAYLAEFLLINRLHGT